MTKALFKKQMMEVFSWVYKDRKSGKIRSAKGIVGYAALYLMVFGLLGQTFYMVADMLCEQLVSVSMGWLYWCFMGLISLFLGVFGSMFNAYTSLYQAKDNDLLLCMPIPTSRILLVRLFGIYTMSLMYELIVIIPAQIVWFLKAPFSVAGAVCVVLIPFILSVLALALSAVAGWVVALVSGHLKNKNIVTVALSLGFIAAYYYFYSKAYSLLQEFLLNIEAVGNKMKAILYPLYHMGLAAEGNLLSMLIFTAIIGALFFAVYAVLSRSFVKLATINKGAAKTAYKERKAKARPVSGALLQKELRRFLGSANYMLNCGLGIIFMPAAAGLLVWKAGEIQEVIAMEIFRQYVPLIAAGAICMIATMNDMAAPSVSLEGKNLWVAQSLPITGRQALTAKLLLQLILTLVPAIPLIAAVEWLIKPNLFFAVLIPVIAVLFILFMASFGLAINLKVPNLSWTNEIVPIKQSFSVMAALFGGWAIIMVLAGLYMLLKSVFSVEAYFILVGALLLACCGILLRWIQTKGARIFETL